jgi:hypothetical protein
MQTNRTGVFPPWHLQPKSAAEQVSSEVCPLDGMHRLTGQSSMSMREFMSQHASKFTQREINP